MKKKAHRDFALELYKFHVEKMGSRVKNYHGLMYEAVKLSEILLRETSYRYQLKNIFNRNGSDEDGG